MASGRFLSTSVAEDDRLGKLSMAAELLYLKTIPHLDRDGMISGKAGLLWGKICPLREELISEMQRAIDGWVQLGLVVRMLTNEGPVLFFPGFLKNNRLTHYDRERPSRYPVPPGYARTNSGLVPEGTEPPKKKPKMAQSPPSSNKNQESLQDLVQESIQDELQDLVQDFRLQEQDQEQDQDQEERATATPLTLTQHPAVAVFCNIWERYPSKPQMKTITEHVTDLELWRDACQAWANKGHKATNVEGMLDFYDHPERFRTPFMPQNHVNGTGPPLTDAEKGKLVTRAQNARASVRTAEKFGGNVDPEWQQDIDKAKGLGLI